MTTRPSLLTSSSLEILEHRIAPAVVFLQTDLNGDGTTDVRITGGGGSERIVIVDSNAGATISIDANNDGDFTDAGDRNAVATGVPIETFEISLGGGHDSLTFTAPGGYNNAEKSLFVDLGTGNNTFTFSQGSATNGTDLRLDIQGSTGNDALDLEFSSTISASRITLTGNLGAGRDAILNSAGEIVGPSLLKFGANGDVNGSSIHVDLDLGTGSNLFETRFFNDQNLPGNVPSTVDINLTGSPAAADVDFLRLDLRNAGPSGPATFRYRADLGAGNDEFIANLPTSLGVFNNTGAVGGYLGIEVLGGAGQDRLSIATSDTGGTQTLDGLLDISLQGGDGDDILSVQLPNLTSSSTTATQRGLRLGMNGGDGRDTLMATVNTTSNADLDLDIAIHGGFGDDLVSFHGLANGGTLTFGPSAQVLLDGGAGTNLISAQSDFTLHRVNFLSTGYLPATLGLTTGDFDGNGSTDLRFLGLTTSERLLIVDAGASLTFSWDRNNDGDFTDVGEINGQVINASLESLIIDTRAGNDTVEIQSPTYSNADRFFSIALGDGNNRLIIPSASDVVNGSDIRFEIQGGKNNDSLDVDFGSNISASRLQFQASLGAGRDSLFSAAGKEVGPGQIDFGNNGDFTDASVRLALDLGLGSNYFRAGIHNDISSGASVVDISLLGSTGSGDKDDLIVDLDKSSVGTTSYLNVFAGLGAGNDRFTLAMSTTAGFNPFLATNNAGSNAGGLAFISAVGGLGNDTLRVDTGTANTTDPVLDGLLDIVFLGGAGDDTITADFRAGGADLTTSNATAVLRGLRLWLEGGLGRDTINAFMQNTATATFGYDLILRGGFGVDKVALNLVNPGNPTFGPAGSILLEKGPGADIVSFVGTATVTN